MTVGFDKRTLVYPQDTQFGERVLEAQGDIILADGVVIDFGVETPGRVFLGERSTVQGSVHAAGDVRVDLFSRITGDVVTAGGAYLGEGVVLEGKLHVEGDLDVGDEVRIEQGFEARGWINIRTPVPMVVYLFIYLLTLMQLGKSEEVERILQEMENGDVDIMVREGFLFVPEGSSIGLQESTVKGNLQVGPGARILGNHDVDGWATVGRLCKLHGALRADGDVSMETHAEVHGEVTSKGTVRIDEGCHVYGGVTADRVILHQNATVDGEIVAKRGVKFVTQQVVAMQEKVEDFDTAKAPDVVDLLG